MNTTDVCNEVEIGADRFAAIVGGIWISEPESTWLYRGLCWHWQAYVPGRIVLAEEVGFRYGVDLTTLKVGMTDAGIMVSGEPPVRAGVPILHVDSIHDAVRRLATHLRAVASAKVIAVTGSIGKTSSCYLLRHLLLRKGRVTTNGQFNYPDGIVCEAGNLGEVNYAVVEASLQGLGEATTILKPHVAVLTNLSPVHIDQAGSLLALAEKKARLFQDLAPGGTAVISGDIAHFGYVLGIARENAETIITFGEHDKADFRLTGYDLSQQRVQARIMGEDVEYVLGLRGRHMALNSLGVLAAAHAAGADWRSLLGDCASATMVEGRGGYEQLEVAGAHIIIIDDAYNASPAAMEAAFAILGSTTVPTNCGRRVAVLADMLELGDDSAEYHRRLSDALLASHVDKVYLAGKQMVHLWEKLPRTVQTPMHRRVSSLLWPLVKDIKDGDVILFKGSHGTGMHKLVADLRYLSLAPYWAGVGPSIFIPLTKVMRWLEPYTPARAKRWVAWQLAKLMKKKDIGVT